MDPIKRGKTDSEARAALPDGVYEELHVRQGSRGPSSRLYRAHPPTGWVRSEGPAQSHRFDLNNLEPTDRRDPRGWPVAFLSNAELRISISRRSEPMPFYARNADWDELIFVHRGMGVIESDYGSLGYEPGDCVVMPRATAYRVVPDSEDGFFVLFESKGEFEPPEGGLKGVTLPQPDPRLGNENSGWEWEVRTLADGEFSSLFYSWDPLDIVGWTGNLTCWKINVRNIETSVELHGKAAFLTPGGVVRCLVAGPASKDAAAQPGPVFHKNADHDEVLFQHAPEPVAEPGLTPGMMSLHGRGMDHGPHIQLFSDEQTSLKTSGYALMLEARQPLSILESGTQIEIAVPRLG